MRTTCSERFMRAAERERALHGADAGGVGVEAEVEVAREAGQALELLLGERRAHAGDHVGDAGLGEGQHVGVALDHVDAVLLARRRLGLVEAEQGLALVVERRLRRVEVLGLLVAQGAGAEARGVRPRSSPSGNMMRPRKRS